MTARAYNINNLPLREIDCIIAHQLLGFTEERPRYLDVDVDVELVLVPPASAGVDVAQLHEIPRPGLKLARDYWVPHISTSEREALAVAERIRPHAWVRILLGRKLELIDQPAIEASIGRYGRTDADFSARGATLAEAVARVAALWVHRPK